jgi:predicted dehydrogenase
VGCGRVAPSHADAFAQLTEAQLYACCDPDLEKAQALADKFSIPHVLSDLDRLLNDPMLESVSLCVPHHLHGPLTEQALEAGKHVLVEKPFALSHQQAQSVATGCRASGLVVQPVCQHRFDYVVRSVKEIVAQDLGKICMVRAHLECKRAPEYYSQSDWRGRWATEGGSVLINQAYHVLDLLLWLVGPLSRVNANMATLTGGEIMETEDTLSANLTFAQGALGGLTVNGASGAQWHSYIEICGSGGVVGFDIGYPNQVPRLQLDSRRSLQKWRKAFAEHFKSCPLPTAGIDYYGDSHRHEASEFVHRIRGGAATVSSTLEQAESVVGAVDALYRSACDGGSSVIVGEVANARA